tara:strand:+ start:349 stop:555 length:207 start_codon:yes stop_codon:yes gene_type:complete
MPRKKAYKYSTLPIKVGDWVLPTNVQVGKFEPAYQVEDETEDGKFVVVQTEGCYQHRMTVDVKKLKRL